MNKSKPLVDVNCVAEQMNGVKVAGRGRVPVVKNLALVCAVKETKTMGETNLKGEIFRKAAEISYQRIKGDQNDPNNCKPDELAYRDKRIAALEAALRDVNRKARSGLALIGVLALRDRLRQVRRIAKQALKG